MGRHKWGPTTIAVWLGTPPPSRPHHGGCGLLHWKPGSIYLTTTGKFSSARADDSQRCGKLKAYLCGPCRVVDTPFPMDHILTDQFNPLELETPWSLLLLLPSLPAPLLPLLLSSKPGLPPRWKHTRMPLVSKSHWDSGTWHALFLWVWSKE